MKSEQQRQAEHLYFQTGLTKTEIAQLIGVSRRSLHYWVRDNHWERIKKSVQHMPTLLAENCYHIMPRLQESILSEKREKEPVTLQEVIAIHKLATTANKLKDRATLNENLEMMTYFLQHVSDKNPAMAEMVKPFVNDYISSRAAIQPSQFMLPNFDAQGHIPAREEDSTEAQLDLEDLAAWAESEAVVSQVETAPELANEIQHHTSGQVSDEKMMSNPAAPPPPVANTINPAPILKGKANNRAARRLMARAAA